VEGIAPVFAWGLDGPRGNADSSPQGFQRDVLPNGIPLLGQLRPNSQSVVVRVRLAAGTIHEAASDSGVAHFTARSTLRGACGRSFEAINLLTDSIGSSLSVDSGREFVEYRVRALAEDLHQMIGLLAQAVIEPDFPDSEVELIRSEQLGAIAETDADTRATADRLMRSAVYPAPNPLGRRSLGTSDSVSQLTAEAVKQYHARRFGPRGSSIAIVGGFGQFEQVVETIGGAFGGWESPEQVMDVLPFADINTIREAAFAAIPGKSQADLAIGIPTISRLDDAYYALDVSNLILGRLGLMGRLGAEVRDRAGLAYYAFSQIEPRADGSLWTARAGVDPANVARTLVAVEREIARMRDEPVSALELEDAKSYLIGVLPLALETHDGVAATLLTIEQFGLGLDYVSRYPAIISAISREDVRNATEAFLDPDRIVIGIAGPDSTNYSQHAS
jgi:zinc protease